MRGVTMGLEPIQGPPRSGQIKIHGPEAFEAMRPGLNVGVIGDAIQRYAESHRFWVVRDFCGHGVGRVFHDAPSILHYGSPDDGPVMREGMLFTVEPMINAGRYEVKVLSDGWTAVTKDRSLSA